MKQKAVWEAGHQKPHPLSYWQRKAERERGTVDVMVLVWDETGAQRAPLEFPDVRQAKAGAKRWVEGHGGSMAEVRIIYAPLHARTRDVEIVGSYEPAMAANAPAMAANIRGGRARAEGFTAADADPAELRRGTEHELEHTSDRRKARQTALDHLAEDPRYYTHLAACEARYQSNGAYWVWALRGDTPLSEGPWGPFALKAAKDYARISATNGAHDRAVSRGKDPDALGFEIVRRYRRRTGARVV